MTSTPMQTGQTTLAAACGLLDQCQQFISGVEQDIYVAPSPRLMGSTIGQHLRHTLDHFSASLTGLDGRDIDYDHRDRDTPVENDLEAGLDELARLRTRLERVPESRLSAAVRVRVMLSAEGDEAQLVSTLSREFAFVTHHGIHHCAMMASIAGEHGAPIPEGFGKAPSTRNYEICATPGAD